MLMAASERRLASQTLIVSCRSVWCITYDDTRYNVHTQRQNLLKKKVAVGRYHGDKMYPSFLKLSDQMLLFFLHHCVLEIRAETGVHLNFKPFPQTSMVYY